MLAQLNDKNLLHSQATLLLGRYIMWLTLTAVAAAGYAVNMTITTESLVILPTMVLFPFISHRVLKRLFPTGNTSSITIVLDTCLFGAALALIQPGLITASCFLIMLMYIGLSNGKLWFPVVQCGLFLCGALLSWGCYPKPVMLDSTTISIVLTLSGVMLFFLVQARRAQQNEQQLRHLAAQERSQMQKQTWLTTTMARYLSPQVRDLIYRGRDSMTRVENRRRRLTVFFSDIEGFTQLGDELEPDVLARILGHYLDEMSQIALRHGGTIDKFIGDSLMVFFGDPVSHGDRQNARAALAMAIEMRRHLNVVRKYWRSQGITQPLNIRMGISTGYCNVGNFGTRDRLDYTIIGRAVNLASRLEGLADSNQILITEETHSLVEEQILCRRSNPLTVKGIHLPVQVYQVIDFRKDLGARSTWLDEELQGFSLYLDTTRLEPIERVKAMKALNRAAQQLKDQVLHGDST